MRNENEHRITILLNEEEYEKLKQITEYLKKYNKERKSIPNLSSKLLFILIEALDDKKTEARTALLSILDKENKEKSIKAMIESIQNDQDDLIDSPKLIENLVFLSNVKKAIKKIEENSIENNIKTVKENKDKENENQKDLKKETKKIEEDKTTEEENKIAEEEQQPNPTQKEEKTKTKVENKETKDKQDDEEEVLRFPDL